jgi:KUP system potassium uptake protein
VSFFHRAPRAARRSAATARIPIASNALRGGIADGGSRGASSPPTAQPSRHTLLGLALLATGVVFGDIGTSPLYAFRLNFGPEVGVAPTPEHVLGVASLIFWSLTLVVSIKYLLLVLRADHEGEGGILMLLAQARPWRLGRTRPLLIVAGLFGAALLYADGVITPAISVLSAVEGLSHFDPAYKSAVVPVTLAILFVLFLLQRRGTASLGTVFGPIVAAWFIAIALLGLAQLVREPQVLWALNPTHALGLLFESGWQSLLVIGTVFLVVTGGEALYADLGHFGRAPIRLAWYGLAYPCLLLNYLGQAALALQKPELAEQAFYALAPPWALGPLIVLATAVTCIASQAIISGAFSLTRQAIELGYLPRMRVVQTSPGHLGQIYVPAINWFLMVVTLLFVVGFGSSESLGGAYGVAISATMLITTLLLSVVMLDRWSWPVPAAVAVILPLLVLDVAFVWGNTLKIAHGGWAPLLIAAVACQLMILWRTGERTLKQVILGQTVSLERFETALRTSNVHRVPGTGVFLSRTGEVPLLLLTRIVERLGTLHERALLVTIETERIPRVKRAQRLAIEERGSGLYLLHLRYGFMQVPDVPRSLGLAKFAGVSIDPDEVTYFILHHVSQVPQAAGLRAWRQWLFKVLERNFDQAQRDNIPSGPVFTVGLPLYLPSKFRASGPGLRLEPEDVERRGSKGGALLPARFLRLLDALRRKESER